MTGVNIKCRFNGGAVMRIRKVDTDEDAGEIDETDSESGGFGECDDSGVVQTDVVFDGYVRRTDLTPPAVGDLLLNVLIAWDGNVAQPNPNFRHLFPRLKILKATKTGQI